MKENPSVSCTWVECRTVSELLGATLKLSTHLIGAPVPGGLDGESEDEAGPGQVTGDGVPEKVEGVWARLVALGTDVARDVGDGLEVERVEIFITSHLVKR